MARSRPLAIHSDSIALDRGNDLLGAEQLRSDQGEIGEPFGRRLGHGIMGENGVEVPSTGSEERCPRASRPARPDCFTDRNYNVK